MGTKDVYNHAIKGQLILKTPQGYIQYADALKKIPFYKNVSEDLGLFSSGKYYFRGKKSKGT